MTWLEKNATALIAMAATFLGALYAAARILWVRLVEKQDQRVLELEAKLETANQRLFQTALMLERLQGKYERELRASASSRPPKST